MGRWGVQLPVQPIVGSLPVIEHATYECFWIQVSSGWGRQTGFSWPGTEDYYLFNPSLSWEEFSFNGGFPEHESWLGRGGKRWIQRVGGSVAEKLKFAPVGSRVLVLLQDLPEPNEGLVLPTANKLKQSPVEVGQILEWTEQAEAELGLDILSTSNFAVFNKGAGLDLSLVLGGQPIRALLTSEIVTYLYPTPGQKDLERAIRSEIIRNG